jgi:hypothetical protein
MRPTTGHNAQNQNNNSSNSSSASSTSAGRKAEIKGGDDKIQEMLDEEEENLCVGKVGWHLRD